MDNDVDLVLHVGDLSYANGDPEVSFERGPALHNSCCIGLDFISCSTLACNVVP